VVLIIHPSVRITNAAILVLLHHTLVCELGHAKLHLLDMAL